MIFEPSSSEFARKTGTTTSLRCRSAFLLLELSSSSSGDLPLCRRRERVALGLFFVGEEEENNKGKVVFYFLIRSRRISGGQRRRKKGKTHELITTLDLLFGIAAFLRRRGDGKDEGERGEAAGAREERDRGEAGMAERERQGPRGSERKKSDFLELIFSILFFLQKKRERTLFF